MTFSQDVKSEIIKSVRNVKGCCAAAFLTAVLKSVGSLALDMKSSISLWKARTAIF